MQIKLHKFVPTFTALENLTTINYELNYLNTTLYPN